MKLLKIVLGVILITLATLLATVFWGAHQMGQDPAERCNDLRNSLFAKMDQAKEVRIIEHSNRWDYDPPTNTIPPEKIYATTVLNASQVALLKAAMFPSKDRSTNTFTACIFEPHHRIEIVNPNNSVSVVEICLGCGELDIGQGQRILPDGWEASLKSFLSSLKMRTEGPWRIEENTTGDPK